MNQEKIHIIQTMTKKTLDKDKDRVCLKCEQKAGRQKIVTNHQQSKRGSVMNCAF